MSPSEYELQRDRNVEFNRILLAQLGLEKPAASPKPDRGPILNLKRKAAADPANRRKSARVAQNLEDLKRAEEEYAASTDEYSSDEDSKPRKSKRQIQKARVKRRASLSSLEGETIAGDSEALRRRIVSGRCVQHISRAHVRPDPKVYGEIAGTYVGQWWPTRMACSSDGVHAPTVAGISGTGAAGAYSVAISGGYEDDIDEGFRFTYTGSGGRDLKGTKNKPKNLRTAPQTSDQKLIGGNLALKVSCDTGLPVRVIRGHKAALGPADGYRYDGLYQVLRAWEDMGLAGFKVWRYAFKRIDGQAPIDFEAGPPDSDEDSEVGSEPDIKGESSIKAESDVEVEPDVKVESDIKAERSGSEAQSTLAEPIDPDADEWIVEDPPVLSAREIRAAKKKAAAAAKKASHPKKAVVKGTGVGVKKTTGKAFLEKVVIEGSPAPKKEPATRRSTRQG